MTRTKPPKAEKRTRTKARVSEVRQKPGPKGFWNSSVPQHTFELARFGHTNEEIAEFFEVSKSTIDNWTREHLEFREALYKGRLESSLQVLDNVYKRANGYTYTETHEEYTYKDGIRITTSYREVTKHVLPNITAAIYLLKARHGDKWADVNYSNITGKLTVEGNIKHPDLSGFDEQEKQLLKKFGLAQLKQLNDTSRN